MAVKNRQRVINTEVGTLRTEAFKENVKRAHNQALVWQSLEAQNPPEVESTEYGWVNGDQNKSLQPVTLPDEVAT